MSIVLTRIPSGVNVRAGAAAQPGLSQTIDMCVDREKYGFVQMRNKANQVFSGAQNANERQQCQDQLRDEEEDCKRAQKMLCAYSYG